MSEYVYMQAPLKQESDIKIFILFLMSKLKTKLDYADIHDIVVQNGLVSPFDFCLNFSDLLKSGHIREENDGENAFYSITETGIDIAANLNGNLLQTTKEKALTNAKMLLNLKKTKSDIQTEIEDLPDGRCRFIIRFRVQYEENLTVTAVTKTRKEAEKMKIDFATHPESFRRALVTLLNDKVTFIPNENPLTNG